MKIKYIIIFILGMLIFPLYGCEDVTDTSSSLEVENTEANNSLNQQSSKAIGQDIAELRRNLNSAKSVLKLAVENPDFIEELHIAFNEVVDIDNRYNAVTFGELESPNAFYKKSENATQVSSDRSRKAIETAYQKMQSRTPGLNANKLREFLVKDRANIYMPNIDIWDGKEIPTITSHPLNEEEAENTGFKPVENSSGKIKWEKVKVDEKYGETNPVLIVMPGESYSYDPYSTQSGCLEEYSIENIEDPCYGDGGGGGGYTPPPSSSEYLADCEGTDCTEGMEVLMGYVELNQYPCGWFCSGRRIYFGQQFAYYNFIDSPITVTSRLEEQPSVYMRSGDRGNWVRYYSQMEPNWAPWQLSKPMNIWVGRGGDWRRVLEGAFQVFEAGGDTEETLNIVYDTFLDMTSDDYQRDVFFEGALDRGNFKASNTTSFGHGTKEGYRVYRVDSGAGSHIRYTFPHQTYVY